MNLHRPGFLPIGNLQPLPLTDGEISSGNFKSCQANQSTETKNSYVAK